MTPDSGGQFLWQEVLPMQQIVLLAALLAAGAGWMYWRQGREHPLAAGGLFVLRCGVIAGLAWVLMGPSRLPPAMQRETRVPLHVLLDVSASMQTADVNGRSRIEQVARRWLNPEQRAALEEDFDLKWSGFDGQLGVLDLARLDGESVSDLARGPVSDYAGSIAAALNAAPAGSQFLILGDGHDSNDAALAPLARWAQDRGQGIHAVGAGSRRSPVDLAILAQVAPPLMMVGEEGELQLRVAQAGLTGSTALVRVEGPGLEETMTLKLDRGLSSLKWPIRSLPPGAYRYRVRVEPLPGELTASNNEQEVFLEVTDRRMRVLLLEGEPYWDLKFIAQALRTDPRVEVHQIMQISGENRQKLVNRPGASALDVPATPQDWSAYDVVVLGRGMENLLRPTQAADLVEAVRERGLHLVMARGRSYDPDTALGAGLAAPMALAEPVFWDRGPLRESPLRLAPAGRDHPGFRMPDAGFTVESALAELGTIRAIPPVAALRPATLVLAETVQAPNAPVLVTMPLGRGTVLAVLGEGLWRWRLLPEGQDRYRGFYENFWSNGLRGLVLSGRYDPGLPVSLRLNRLTLAPGEKLVCDLFSRSAGRGLEGLELEVIDPRGEILRPPIRPLPGSGLHAQIELQPRIQGSWRVRLTGGALGSQVIEKPFGVYEIDLERLMSEARRPVLRELARQSGGLYFDVEESVDLAGLLKRARLSGQVPPEPVYAWDRGWVLAALIALLGIEWLMRRKWGWI